MISPGFHSAAFLVHLSGLWVAIRRACHHFSFSCVSTQVGMLCVNMFSSASLALLFTYSIQSSNSSSWFDVLSVSSSNEMLLSWSVRMLIFFAVIRSTLLSQTHPEIFDDGPWPLADRLGISTRS